AEDCIRVRIVTGVQTCALPIFGYGVSADRGRVVYDSAQDRGIIRWPADGDSGILTLVDRTARAIAGPTGHLTDTNRMLNSTWHQIGRASCRERHGIVQHARLIR